NEEIINQSTSAVTRLCTYAGAPGHEVALLNFRDEFLQRLCKRGLRKGTIHFTKPRAPVLGGHFLKAWPCKGCRELAKIDIGFAIALAAKSKHGIGARFYTTAHHPGKVHSEKRKVWIGNRIDQIPDKVLAVFTQFVVFTAKRNDSDINFFRRCE